jgi:competence protein ComEA
MRRSVLTIIAGLSLLLAVPALAGTAGPEGSPVRKDINEATAKDLIKINGIGKKTAAKIIDKRTELGKFTSMYQIKEIKGFGRATLVKLICAFYVKEEGELPCKPPKAAAVPENKININTADIKELTKIKGMGKKKAAKVIDYRRDNGWFKSAHELTNIKGIGKKTVENMLPYVEVRLDVNKARAAQFEALGFANGDKILENRKKNGGFKSLEDFSKKAGVKIHVFAKVKEVLTWNAKESK